MSDFPFFSPSYFEPRFRAAVAFETLLYARAKDPIVHELPELKQLLGTAVHCAVKAHYCYGLSRLKNFGLVEVVPVLAEVGAQGKAAKRSRDKVTPFRYATLVLLSGVDYWCMTLYWCINECMTLFR